MSSNVAGLGVLALLCAAVGLPAQNVDPGRKAFESRCARCHGADGNGGEMGPPIVLRLATRDDEQLIKLIHEGLPARGMPPSDIAESRDGRPREVPAHDSTPPRRASRCGA